MQLILIAIDARHSCYNIYEFLFCTILDKGFQTYFELPESKHNYNPEICRVM